MKTFLKLSCELRTSIGNNRLTTSPAWARNMDTTLLFDNIAKHLNPSGPNSSPYFMGAFKSPPQPRHPSVFRELPTSKHSFPTPTPTHLFSSPFSPIPSRRTLFSSPGVVTLAMPHNPVWLPSLVYTTMPGLCSPHHLQCSFLSSPSTHS